jgi:hypothetical protein
MNPIQISAILGRVATKSDGSLALTFSTSEMNAEECTVLFKLTRIELVMLLTPKGVALEAPVEVKSELGGKTQAQRLRGVLFVLYRHLLESQLLSGKGFDVWYHERMEAFIDHIKSQLPEP